MAKILITGAAGFIGSQLSYRLWNEQHEITMIDDFSYGSTDNLIFEKKSFLNDVIRLDITNYNLLDQLFSEKQFDYVYHIAGIAPLPDCQSNPNRAVEVNIGGTVNILECSKKYGVKNVIFASTSAIYERNIIFPCREEDVVPPTLIYPSTKYCSEQFCKSYYETYGLNVSIMRFANVYGPHIDCLRKQPPFVAYVIRELFYNRSPVLHSDGKQSRDYVYIDDLLDLAVTLMNNTGFDVVNVSSNTAVSVSEMYNLLAELMGKKIDATYVDSANYWSKYPQLYAGKMPIKKEILDAEVNKYTLCDNTHAKSKYGWAPKISMREGFKRTIEYTIALLSSKT